jgi:hypothetical protein
MDKEPILRPVEALKKEDRKVALLVFLVFVALTLWICLLPQEYKSGSALSHTSVQPTVPEKVKDADAPEASGSTQPARGEHRSDPDDSLPGPSPR